MAQKPCVMARIIYEKAMFPDVQTEGINTRDFLFYGSKQFQIPIKEFLKKEVQEVYVKATENWEYEIFQEFMDKFSIMFRETILRHLRNLNR
jgi:hypothetical protein